MLADLYSSVNYRQYSVLADLCCQKYPGQVSSGCCSSCSQGSCRPAACIPPTPHALQCPAVLWAWPPAMSAMPSMTCRCRKPRRYWVNAEAVSLNQRRQYAAACARGEHILGQCCWHAPDGQKPLQQRQQLEQVSYPAAYSPISKFCSFYDRILDITAILMSIAWTNLVEGALQAAATDVSPASWPNSCSAAHRVAAAVQVLVKEHLHRHTALHSTW